MLTPPCDLRLCGQLPPAENTEPPQIQDDARPEGAGEESPTEEARKVAASRRRS